MKMLDEYCTGVVKGAWQSGCSINQMHKLARSISGYVRRRIVINTVQDLRRRHG